MKGAFIFIFFCTLQYFFSKCSTATDILAQTQSILDNQTLVSSSGSCELGFFSPNSSKNRYLGIWFKIIPKPVFWVANRNNPLTDSSGTLKINENKDLVLLNGNNSVVWSSSSNSSKTDNPVIVQLLESGNLVLRYESNNDPGSYIWQSFDYPSDSLLDGMKVGCNLQTGFNRNLTSWKSSTDPSPGEFTAWVDPRGFPQFVVHKGSDRYSRSGPWNGVRFSGAPELDTNSAFYAFFIFNTKEAYIAFERGSNFAIMRFVIGPSGLLQLLKWNERKLDWSVLQEVQKDRCDYYNVCGANGICNINKSPICDCLKGFTPKSQQDWDGINWSGGCIRKTPLDCPNDGSVKVVNVKLPDTSGSFSNTGMSLKECKAECLKDCSCVAYANSDIREGGRGCLKWFADLVDIRLSSSNGQDLYLRMAASELDCTFELICEMDVSDLGNLELWEEHTDEIQENELELPTFDILRIEAATNNFSLDKAQSTLINWEKRFKIIIGIAQGLLYLHRDSRLRIIHRDLKASNVLLDSAMNPKISDFGMAKTFGGDQMEGNTDRVVGTYGYMSPEYAIDGLFSVKSDVYSFGVLIIEIASGRRNRGFEHHDHDLNLLGHAWKLWNEGKALKLIDTSMEDPLPEAVLRCIHVGLLCVQQRPEDRPNMAYVVLMLTSDTVSLPEPKQPGFYYERSLVNVDSSEKRLSSNEETISSIQGR
ncbi:hypothetical protein GIB67_025208 [Kingdonia uniflora]|uniref:Receptor-like serine/threonine-protein kinase n=1 Tax=Kingdonia uniflora TaxID=39325 RepID=A0A7J7N8I8_9MAGN|nr:hypothetical protein GIB67_025208 [Kingdonia uniflora]